MKKKVLAVMMSMVCILGCLSGCGAAGEKDAVSDAVVNAEDSEDSQPAENAKAAEDSKETENAAETIDADDAAKPQESTDETAEIAEAVDGEKVDISVGSLKGPTSMGLVYLMDQSEEGEASENYTFTMAAAADELLVQIVSGDMDIALVPANVASVLYHKTEGGISVIDINTLGVLYMVSGDDSIQSMEDLKGKTIYLTGKGTTPDYVLQYLLTENGLTLEDVTLEYKSEATEVVAVLTENSEAIGVLPQPFVTAACMQNEALSVVMDLTKEWAAIQGEGGSSLVTGVTIVRNNFLEENPQAVAAFMEEHKQSAAFANENTSEAAELVASYGIIEKAAVAAKAMPYCNITYIDGEDMKTALAGYLEVLCEQDASSIGGSLPADDFYYIP